MNKNNNKKKNNSKNKRIANPKFVNLTKARA